MVDGIEEKTLECLVDGEFLPCTEASATGHAIEKALTAAKRVHEDGSWFSLGLDERCKILAELPAKLNAAVEQAISAADASETGISIGLTRMINSSLKEMISPEQLKAAREVLEPRRLKTAHGTLTQARHPFGPLLVIAPWNVPSATVWPKVLAALLAGSTVIVKPSEWAPTGLDIFLRALNSVGLPPGVLQWLHGGPDVGRSMVEDARVAAVHFTGSREVGRAIARACAERLVPCLAELGGSNVAIVLEDADLDLATAGLVTGLTFLNGQWCAGVSRIYVHADVATELLDKVMTALRCMKVGPANDETTDFGPLAHPAHLEQIQAHCEELVKTGGVAVRAHEELPPGNFFSPTIVKDFEGEPVDEIFGPLATWQTFGDVAEAVRMANLKSLLQCYVYGADQERATSLGFRLNCGSIMVNGCGPGFDGVTTESGEPVEPEIAFFGGSGVGVEAGIASALRFVAGCRNVGISG